MTDTTDPDLARPPRTLAEAARAYRLEVARWQRENNEGRYLDYAVAQRGDDLDAAIKAEAAAPDSRHEYVFECGNCREEITAFIPCIRAAAPDAEAMDGPTTYKPHGTPFGEWTILSAELDGVRWYFHVPTAAIAAAVPDAGLREKIAIILGCEIAASSQSCDHKMLADRILAALAAHPVSVNDAAGCCIGVGAAPPAEAVSDAVNAALEGNQDAGGIPRGPWDVIRDVIRYCQTCGKTRFVEWPHRNCPPDADR